MSGCQFVDVDESCGALVEYGVIGMDQDGYEFPAALICGDFEHLGQTIAYQLARYGNLVMVDERVEPVAANLPVGVSEGDKP